MKPAHLILTSFPWLGTMKKIIKLMAIVLSFIKKNAKEAQLASIGWSPKLIWLHFTKNSEYDCKHGEYYYFRLEQ